jgi:Bacterial protein of unknown function (Gcw_chp)
MQYAELKPFDDFPASLALRRTMPFRLHRSVRGRRAMGTGTLLALAIASFGPGCFAEEASPLKVTAILAATSDYVYRGVSQRNGSPTPFLYVAGTSGIFYANGFVIGTDLGRDALDRSIGNMEADATVGITPSVGKVSFNFGAKYTGYPNGRDIIVGTTQKAERDFIEPFAGATLNVTDAIAIGGTVYWTPNYYYQTGQVTTVEGEVSIVLPVVGDLHSKFTTYLGQVESQQANVASPGHGYLYYNAGIEAQAGRMLFDLRYWNTDVDDIKAFDQRFVVSMGVSLW